MPAPAKKLTKLLYFNKQFSGMTIAYLGMHIRISRMVFKREFR
jgi:hypothetical protein